MRGHKLSQSRQLNRHWQSGDSKMRDFNYIWLSCYHLISYYNYRRITNATILLLPRHNRIYFNMNGYQSPDYHIFDPYIFSKDFKIQLAGKEFSTADLYQTYVDHPEKFHNLMMEEVSMVIAGETISVYRISFTDTSLEPSDYYIEYKWKNTNEENIHFTYYLTGGDQYLNYQLVGEKTLNLKPIHDYYPPYKRQIYSDCETDFIHYFTTDYVINNGYYYIADKRYYLYSYFFFPEHSVEGGIRKIDINNMYTSYGGWNLGPIITANYNIMNFFNYYKYRNQPEVVYAGVLWYVYSQFNYDAPYYDVQIHYGGMLGDDLNLCKYFKLVDNEVIYEDPSLIIDGEPVIKSEFYYIDYYRLGDDPQEIQFNWIQLQKWRENNE